MKRPFFFLSMALLAAALSCSKQGPAPQQPTPVPAKAQAAAPTEIETPEPLEYVVEDLKGTVLIIENGSTQPEPAEEEETVEAGDEIITKSGSQVTLTLDENTMFQVSENSDIKVDQLKPNAPNGFISQLKLVEGKVLSEVEKLQETHSTFEISSGGVVCGVRGTAFEVQKQGQMVHTSTFHGIVEMKKGDQVQQVGANQHVAFSFKKQGFLPIRKLQPQEKKHYQNWVKKQPVIRQRQAQRMQVIHSLASLPPEQRKQVLQDLKTVKPKDRMRALHQDLQKRSLSNHVPEPKPAVMNRPNPQEKFKDSHPKGYGPSTRDHRPNGKGGVPQHGKVPVRNGGIQKRNNGQGGLKPGAKQGAFQKRRNDAQTGPKRQPAIQKPVNHQPQPNYARPQKQPAKQPATKPQYDKRPNPKPQVPQRQPQRPQGSNQPRPQTAQPRYRAIVKPQKPNPAAKPKRDNPKKPNDKKRGDK